MSKIKALKELLEESPEQVAKIIRAMKGEADDAAVKLGSGKNLKALKEAGEDIAEKSRLSQPPAYPKNVVQDELANTQGFKLEGAPYSKEGIMVPEGTGVPALRTQTMPEVPSSFRAGDVEVPFKQISEADELAKLRQTKPSYNESVGNSSSLASTADELQGSIDDVLKPSSNNIQLDQGKEIVRSLEDVLKPRFTTGQKVGGAAVGVAGVGGLMSMGGDEKKIQIPDINKKTPTANEGKQTIVAGEKKEESKKTQQQAKTAPNLTDNDQQKLIEIGKKLSQSPESVTKDDVDYLSMLKQAQESDDQSRFINNLLRAGTTIGAAIAGVKPDYSGVEALDKQINKAANVKQLMTADMSQKKLEAAKRQLEDDKALRDPQSEISKQLRGLLVKAGYPVAENVSAKSLKDMGVNPYNILTSIESARIAATARKDAMEDRAEAKARTEITSMVNNFSKSKDVERYNSAKEALDALNLAMETKDKTAMGSAFMKFAKEAQGDTSVVRDGDMRILAGGYNFLSPEQMITKLAAKAQGGDFNETELQQMKRVVQMGISARQKRIQQQASPIFSRIQKSKMDESIFFDPTLASELKGTGQEQATTSTQVYTPQQEAGIKAYADSKGISREEAISRLKTAKRL
jgi:hypothetical protein